MFTGLIEEVGKILRIQNTSNISRIKIEANKVLEDVKIGDSISVNGVCLTVTEFQKKYFVADIMKETKDSTTFNKARPGQYVNLERALKLGDRLGGHSVSGHVDTVGQIRKINRVPGKYDFVISINKDFLIGIKKKGSVAIDGISLTVADKLNDSFVLSLIPHTLNNTILRYKKVRDFVNVEVEQK